MIKDNTVICPVCQNRNVIQLFNTDSLAVVKHLLNADKIALKEPCRQKIEELWGNENAAYYHCRECTFEFAQPFIAGDAEFYSLIYDSESNYPADKWEYSVTLLAIKQFLNSFEVQPRLLEIGAGNGSFLKILAGDLIPVNKIFATEFSEAGVKSIRKLGISCLKEDLRHISEKDVPGKAGIICMFQVLEHMADINAVFEKLNELTIPGSRMYISVPNDLHRHFFDQHGHHLDLPPVHIGRYNMASLGMLSEAHGWKILQHIVQPTVFKERILKFIYSAYTRGQLVLNPEKVRVKFLRLFLRYSMLAILMIIHINIIIGLRNPHLGTSQWFELERIKTE